MTENGGPENRAAVDFDKVASSYRQLLTASVRFSGEEDEYFDHYKLDCLKRWLLNSGQRARVLDFGCGIGKLAGLIAAAYPQSHVSGYDVSSKSIEVARRQWEGTRNLSFGTGFEEGSSYDLITAANVFHHIRPNDRENVLTLLLGKLARRGMLVIFEHNPFNPLTRHVVRNCAFDADAHLISLGGFVRLALQCQFRVVQKRYIIFFPGFLKMFRKLEPSLDFLPMGAQYMLVLGRA